MEIKGPLSGITVIDLTRVLAGPYCTLLLADLGARIIKVERPETGDDSRNFGPFENGKSIYYASINRQKESIAIDLKSKDGLAQLHALLEKADILVENFRAGTMDKLGLGWEVLRKRYPSLIFASTSGFGQTGPYSHRPAYDMVAQAMGGIMSLTGHPGGPPTRVGSSIGDLAAGMFTTMGINAALFHREKTGEGMLVDVSMLDSQVAILENMIPRHHVSGEIPGPIGARHPTITPFAAFEVKDGHIVVAAGNDAIYARLCEAMGREELIDNPLFESNPLRTDHEPALKDELEVTLRTKTAEEWLAIFEQADVPCSPINNVAQVVNDPQVNARNMIVEADDPVIGSLKMSGNPMKFSAFADPTKRNPAPALDEDGDNLRSEFKIKL